MSETKSEKLIEYNKDNATNFCKEFRQDIDDYLIGQTGADASILWELGGRIVLKATIESGDTVTLELASFEIASGYNTDLHLYVLGGKVFVEDDYDWNEIPDLALSGNIRSVYADSFDEEEYHEDDEDYDDEDYEGDKSYSSPTGRISPAYSSNDIFSVNYFEEYYRDSLIRYEPLIVNNFNLDNPILKVEKAYRNALCEIESYPTCGWIILLHEGHFYIPVESIEDPVNHDAFYYVKIFNSYPVAVTSGRISALAGAEIFNQTYTIGVRYRSGYCINWRKLFFDYLLPDNYLDLIPDLYTVTDKPYGATKDQESDYDGFQLREQGDDFDDPDDFDDGSNDS